MRGLPAPFVIEQAGGGPAVIAEITRVTGERIKRQSLQKWEFVPSRRVGILAALSGIPAHVILPDVFYVIGEDGQAHPMLAPSMPAPVSTDAVPDDDSPDGVRAA